MLRLFPGGGFQNSQGLEYGIIATLPEACRIITGKDFAIKTKTKRKRKKKQERYAANFRFTLGQYEYVARKAKAAIHNSMQRIIDDMIFSRPWKEEMDALRKQQAKLGYPESDFWPRAYKIKMGIKSKQGRRASALYRRAS